jgi:ABC-2 type transport system permease protein
VADVAQMPGVWQQLKLIGGLRWHILRNGLRRKNNRWDLIGMIWAALFGGALVLGTCFAFYAGMYEFLMKNRPQWIALLFWGLFVWWQIFPLFAAGFGANFEFKTLLRFPLSMRAFYLLGMGYGLADFAAVSSIAWIISMLAGAMAARAGVVPVLLLVSGLFVLLNVTIERLIGSWMEKVLAKRKTRELFFGLFILSMVSLNFLSPIMRRMGGSPNPKSFAFVHYLWWTPPSLAGSGVAGAAHGDLRAFLVGFAGLLIWIGITSGFLWGRFRAQYFGEELGESGAPKVAKKRESRADDSSELPRFISPSVAAVMAKEFRYLTRNGFAFITFLLPPIMVIFFSMQFAGKNSVLKEHGLSTEMFFPALMAYLILILLSPAYNSFAFEGRGIQTYFMTPMRFRDVLLGKNLLLAVLVILELSISVGVMIWRVGWPSPAMFVSTVAAVAFAVVGQLSIANWSSLMFPKKMEIGRMKGQRNSGVAVWIAFGAQITIGGICAVILFAGRWTGNPWLPAIAFAGLTAAAAGGYTAALGSMDRLAEKKRELLIETLCR